MVKREPQAADAGTGVRRRRFLAAAGTAGVAMGVAGCLAEGRDAVEIAMDADWADIEEDVVQGLYDAGLDSSIEVDFLPGEMDSAARRASFTAALDAGRSTPDVFMMDTGWAISFIVREQTVNLSENLGDETLGYVEEDYLPAAVDSASHPETGDLHGLPLFPDYPVMHYRKDLVEEAGYDPDGANWATEPMSWQAFAEMAADVWENAGGEDAYTYAFTTQGANYEGTSCCTFNEAMTSFGGAYFGDHENLFGPVGDRPITVNEEPVHETLRMFRSFMVGPDGENAHPDIPRLANTDIVEFTEEEARDPFTSGDAIFLRNWPYAIPINLDEGAFDADAYDVMPLPYGVEADEATYEGTGGTSHALGGWHLTVNPNTQRLDECLQILEAFATEEVMLQNFELGGYLPPDQSVLDDADEGEAGDMTRFIETLSVAGDNTVPRPATTRWPGQSLIISSDIHAAYTASKSPEEAMADLEDELVRTEED